MFGVLALAKVVDDDEIICSVRVVFSLGLSARTMAQQERVTLNMKNVSFESLFNEIQRQTKLSFLFNHELVDHLGKVSVKASEETVEKVLNSLFDKTAVTWTVQENMIVVKEKAVQTPQQAEMVKSVWKSIG